MENSYRYFCNKECQYFPCHDIPEDGNFNCMFCYCPLYPLGKHCGGNFKYIGVNDQIKDCSACNFPHKAESYESIMSRVQSMIPYYANTRMANTRMNEEFMFKANPPLCKRYSITPKFHLDINDMIPCLDSDYDPEPMLLVTSTKTMFDNLPGAKDKDPSINSEK